LVQLCLLQIQTVRIVYNLILLRFLELTIAVAITLSPLQEIQEKDQWLELQARLLDLAHEAVLTEGDRVEKAIICSILKGFGGSLPQGANC
jgi:hypothetical protein